MESNVRTQGRKGHSRANLSYDLHRLLARHRYSSCSSCQGRKASIRRRVCTRQRLHRSVREGIVSMHRNGLDPSSLNDIVAAARPERRENVKACISGYRKWMARQGIVWTRRPSPKVWRKGELEVRLNP